jgi:hypothetical protein
VLFYFLPYITGESSAIGKNITIEILTCLQVFSTPGYERYLFLNDIELYVFVCTSLAPEFLGEFLFCSVFKNSYRLGQTFTIPYKVCGCHCNEYEECRLLGYRNPGRTSQETHYISVTEPIWLMLCKVWGFHGTDYEECRLLGYKTPVRTSQETHYISATEPSLLILCKVWGFHWDDCEECRLLGCGAVWLL